ncbi:uncharacterized protein [Miscanthus floridulus]|uniref:uncharacterized protein n=1 Tax=Miscanthus floridulus TaxID=154761 RepID=UPI00345AB0E5
MAEMVCSALVQETVSKGVSFALGKREEKASQGHLMERLEMAVSQLEFALERAQERRIWHLSLICRRKQIKSAYVEATELLDKHKQQQAVPAGQELQDAHGVKKRKLWVISAKNMLTTSSFAGLSTDDVRRFEWYADFADKFVRDVESGCSLHHNTFCNPIVRHLLEGKTFWYYLKQGNVQRTVLIFPMYFDERGVEAQLAYSYMDSTMIEKCFTLVLSLRLSESTDIVGVAIKGLQLLTAEFKHPVECAMGELTLLRNLQDTADLSWPPLVRCEEIYSMLQTQLLRPDPACCKGSRHGLCANNNVSSELSDILPEQVIYWGFKCYIPAVESSTRSLFDEVGRGWKPPLQVVIAFRPHLECISYWVRLFKDLIERDLRRFYWVRNNKYIYAVERIGDDVENEKWINDVSVQEVSETIKSKAINCFSRQPELREYILEWASEHGSAMFTVEKGSVETAGVPRTRKRYSTRARTRTSSRR